MLWKTRQVSRQVMPSWSMATPPPHVDYGCWSLVEVSLSLLHHQELATGHVGSVETDVRTLSVPLNPRGKRACASSDAVHKMEEHALHDFPIQGPRTTRWLLLEIARGELGPVARHHWWRQAMGLSSSDPGVDEHLFLCELLGHGSQYDQHDLPDLALGEVVSRRLAMWEGRYAEKLRASTAGGVTTGHATERHLFLGGARPKE